MEQKLSIHAGTLSYIATLHVHINLTEDLLPTTSERHANIENAST